MIADWKSHRYDRVQSPLVSLRALMLLIALAAGVAAAGQTAAEPPNTTSAPDCGYLRPVPARLPLIDAHLHYSSVDLLQTPPDEVITLFDRLHVRAAVVLGRPGPLRALRRAAPERIFPFLSLYQTADDKRDWMHDDTLPARATRLLEGGDYRGLGELHIFAQDRDSPVLAALVELASTLGLLLMIHGDAAVIEAIFARAPELTLIWAHLGTEPTPAAIAPMLERYPSLYVDTSVRDERFTDADGCLREDWRQLFIEHSEQILVGVDTHWPPRWQRFGEVVGRIRGWLGQLPPAVAEGLAYRNAARVLGLADAAPDSAQSSRLARNEYDGNQ
jgi:hypothetical protein